MTPTKFINQFFSAIAVLSIIICIVEISFLKIGISKNINHHLIDFMSNSIKYLLPGAWWEITDFTDTRINLRRGVDRNDLILFYFTSVTLSWIMFFVFFVKFYYPISKLQMDNPKVVIISFGLFFLGIFFVERTDSIYEISRAYDANGLFIISRTIRLFCFYYIALVAASNLIVLATPGKTPTTND